MILEWNERERRNEFKCNNTIQSIRETPPHNRMISSMALQLRIEAS